MRHCVPIGNICVVGKLMKKAFKIILGLIVWFGVLVLIGTLFLRAIDKTVENDQRYGWHGDADGNPYREVDIARNGG